MPELLSRLQVALADRYRIESEIGAGGMATVYLAQDLRHDRKVALKLLRPELSAVIGAERFLAEIKLTANLQHPHILPLFDSGEADGFLFYVMPFVEGEIAPRAGSTGRSSSPWPTPSGSPPRWPRALDYAHRHGVVHRDIKPENILLHDGRALVADFGIALAASKAGGNRMTETGMSLGTPHYMCPEQAMGEREITARSDVYALGVVLYEMLTGDPPFTGSTAQAIVARVLTESPRPHPAPAPHHPAPRRGGGDDRAREAAGRPVRHGGGVRRGAGGPGHGAHAPHRGDRCDDRCRAGAKTRLDPVKIGLAGAAVAAAALAAWGWLRPAPTPEVNRFSLYFRRSRRSAAVTSRATGSRSRPMASGSCTRPRRSEARSSGSGSTTSSAPRRSPEPKARARRSSRLTAAMSGFVLGGTKIRTVSLDGGPTQSLTDSVNTTGGDWGRTATCTSRWTRASRASAPPVARSSRSTVSSPRTRRPARNGRRCCPVARASSSAPAAPNQAWATSRSWRCHSPTASRTCSMRGVYARYSPTGHLLVVTADGKLVARRSTSASSRSAARRSGCSRGSGSKWADSPPTWPCPTTARWSTPPAPPPASRQPVWVTREGLESPVDSTWEPQGTIDRAALSPDGRALAVDVHAERVELDLDQADPDGSLLAAHLRRHGQPAPDLVRRRPLADLHRDRRRTNGGALDDAPRRRHGHRRSRWSRLLRLRPGDVETHDGKWILARRSFFEAGSGDIYGIRKGDSTLVPLVTGPASEVDPAVSPDGRWLAYASNESGTAQVYVRPFPDAGSARWQVSTAGGVSPVWSHSGKELFYRSTQEQLMTRDGRGRAPLSRSSRRSRCSRRPITS